VHPRPKLTPFKPAAAVQETRPSPLPARDE
jgi:hypothetical protein